MRPRASIVVALVALLGADALVRARAARAHSRTSTFSELVLDGSGVTWRVRVRVADLLAPLGLGEDAVPGALDARLPDAGAYVARHLAVTSDGNACATRIGPAERAVRPEPGADPEVLVVARFVCPAGAPRVEARYDLFFDLDPLHTGFVVLDVAGRRTSAMFRWDSRVLLLVRPVSALAEVRRFVALGVEHIFTGYDHLAFVFALLLVAARGRGGLAAASFGGAVKDAWVATLALVTAFTVAHSATLIAAALRPGLLPESVVEPAIALSVVWVGLENLVRKPGRGRWMLAFGFGLVHGFGFASVLAEVGLPEEGLVRSLLAFNVGVELGQLAVVAVALPGLVAVGRRWPAWYDRTLVRAASACIAALGAYWFLARVLG